MPSNVLKNTTLILMSAGDSSRFCKDFTIKKQWLRVESKPLWLFVADNLNNLGFQKVIITASKNDFLYMTKLCDYEIIKGGETRLDSLKNALNNVNTEFIMVSDVARFGIDSTIVKKLCEEIKHYDCVAPRVKVSDTAIYKDSYIDREQLYRIQTPQISRLELFKKALTKTNASTDESSIMFEAGYKVGFIEGSHKYEKLTYKSDLYLLESKLDSSIEVKVGNGIDIHAFEEGKVMKLGGVTIPSDFGFKAHSDGDVLIHSIIDAILGALNAGDIGEWFPDNKSEFKNIDSSILLKQIADFTRSVGFEISHLDSTIIAQAPKISPFKSQIASNLAKILNLPKSAISIKATTAENMGFIGKKEGILVNSVATLNSIKGYK